MLQMENDYNAVITATKKGLFYHGNGNGIPQNSFKRYDDTYQVKAKNYNTSIDNNNEVRERLHLNLIQRQMYRRLMYGLKEYNPEEIASLSPPSIAKIVDDYKSAKRAIHVLKSKMYYGAETKLLTAMMKRTDIGKHDYDWYLDLPKNLTLRKLNISTIDVVSDFIRRKLLPKNFFNLTPESLNL